MNLNFDISHLLFATQFLKFQKSPVQSRVTQHRSGCRQRVTFLMKSSPMLVADAITSTSRAFSSIDFANYLLNSIAEGLSRGSENFKGAVFIIDGLRCFVLQRSNYSQYFVAFSELISFYYLSGGWKGDSVKRFPQSTRELPKKQPGDGNKQCYM